MTKTKVLDHGFIELIDTLGNDLTVVNSARVSFGKRKTEMDESDKKLINYLAKHKHWSPFRHVQLQFHCKVPEFIARQWYKHVVGCNYTSVDSTPDHAWNEISMRYVDAGDFDFYCPKELRQQSSNNKQCSTEQLISFEGPDGKELAIIQETSKILTQTYKFFIESNVAREQARMVLPLNIYTEFYWTASLQAVANFIALRKHEGAQYEIRQYAEAMEEMVKKVLPVSMEALGS